MESIFLTLGVESLKTKWRRWDPRQWCSILDSGNLSQVQIEWFPRTWVLLRTATTSRNDGRRANRAGSQRCRNHSAPTTSREGQQPPSLLAQLELRGGTSMASPTYPTSFLPSMPADCTGCQCCISWLSTRPSQATCRGSVGWTSNVSSRRVQWV